MISLNKKLIPFIFLLGVVFVYFFIVPINRLVSYLSYPIIRFQQRIIDPIKRHYAADQYEDDSSLQGAYELLQQKYIRLQATFDFYQDIQELVSFKKRYDIDCHCVAQVLQRHLGADQQYLLLDKGSRDGVEADMVVVYKDMLVGKITQVYPLYARCMLITDKRCKVAGYCAETKACGVLQGMNNDSLKFLHVSHLNDVVLDDIIISSGHGTIFPRGFGLSRVIEYRNENFTYDIVCKPLVDFSQITYCSIINFTKN